jgi:DNA primase
VLGFGARAMREDPSPGSEGAAAAQGGSPKYLNTSDNDVYHKGRHLYGADLARAHAARAGEVILCEGYTDVIALHQAGLKNAVGLMGTALTDEQVGELARMASTVLLALDADSAGQEAMLRAAGLAAQRKLELRVVELPPGTDPAELLQREGVGAIEAAVRDSVAFVRFRVEQILAKGDSESPEGRDRTIEELRPVFATLPPSAMRLELTRVVSERLELPESLAETLLASTAAARPPAVRALSRREELERTFLALCIASPEAGARALSELELGEHFTGETLRRVAAHLREGDLREPMSGGALERDPELAAILAELVVLAGRESPRPAMLESQRQQLELARVDRQIQAARARGSGEVNELARRRADIKQAFDGAYERALEETGGSS